MVLLAAPAGTAGAICLDRARGASHMLVTDLSSFEIVVGKLAARMVPVVGILLCFSPIPALASLLGGIEPAKDIVLRPRQFTNEIRPRRSPGRERYPWPSSCAHQQSPRLSWKAGVEIAPNPSRDDRCDPIDFFSWFLCSRSAR